MLQFIFDLDDTLLFHQNDINYNYICENKELSYYLDNLQYPKYILTNGTSDHAKLLVTGVLNKFAKLKDSILNLLFLKFPFLSFQVQHELIYLHYFLEVF